MKCELGDIRNYGFSRKTKLLAFSKISQVFREVNNPKISPTDIEGIVERKGRFLFWEFKSKGTTVPRGQSLMYERLLSHLGRKGTLLICEHEVRFEEDGGVSIPDDIIGFSIVHSVGSHLVESEQFPGNRLTEFCERWATTVESGQDYVPKSTSEKSQISA